MAASLRIGAAGLLALVAAACYTPRPLSPTRAVEIWTASRSTAPDAVDKSGPLDLTADEAVELALRNNPDLRALRARTAVAAGKVSASDQLQNPELRLSQLRLDQMVDGKTTLELGMRFRPERPGTLGARTHEAEMSQRAEEAEIANAARVLTEQVRALHAGVALSDEEIREAVREIELRKERLEYVSARVDAATATKLDLSMARLDLATAVDERLALVTERERDLSELKRLLSLPKDQELGCRADDGDLEPKDVTQTEEELIRMALESRPELSRRAARIAEAEAEAFQERAEQYPWFSFVEAGYDFMPDQEPLAFAFGIGIDLPLFSLNSGKIEEADAVVDLRRIEEETEVRAIADEVRAALVKVRSTAERLASMEQSLLPAAKDSSDALRKALEAGVMDPLSASVIEEHRVRARRRYLQAMRQHREALIALEAAVGRDL